MEYGTPILHCYLMLIFVSFRAGQTFQLSSSCGGTVQIGGSCTLRCQTSQSAISWSSDSIAYIQERNSCSSLVPSAPSDYTSACPNSTTFTFSFTNARYDRDSKTWQCGSSFGPIRSNKIQIEVTVPLTSVTLARTSTSIICTAVSYPSPSITLYRDGSSVFTSPPAVNGSNGWTATLNYQLTGDSRNYVYWCQASNTQTSVNSTYSLPQIAVTNVLLKNISNNNQEVGAAEGQPLTLTCVTSASYPPASATWYKNNVQVTSGVSDSTEVTSGLATVTTSVVTFTSLSRSDLGHQVYCTATNQHTSSPVQSNTARIGVWYGPDQVDITHPDNTPAIENRNLTLTCTVTAYPAPTFRWEYSDGTSTGGSTGSPGSRWSQTLTFKPNKNKLTVRCETKNIQTSATKTATETLDVKYPPPNAPSITTFPSTMFEGNRQIITCSVTGGKPLGNITWTCPGNGTQDASTNGQTRTSTLNFMVTRGQNGEQCRCQGSWHYGGYSQSDVRNFNVSYPPTKPSLSVPSTVCEGRPVSSIGCSSEDPGNPSATYTWTKKGNPVFPGFSPVRTDNGASIRCSAGNIFTERPGQSALQSDSKTINVHYSPDITIQSAPTHPLKEGDSLSMLCVSDSNPSTSDNDIKWMFDGKETQGPRLQKSDVSRHDDGVYTCRSMVNSGTCGTLHGNKAEAVTVNYPPNVTISNAAFTEGDPLTLTCQAEGRPSTYNFRSFTQYWGDTEIQTRAGQQTSDIYTLRIDTVSYLDSGVYVCSVDNNVTDRDGVLIKRKKVNVEVRARPKFTRDSKSTVGSEVGGSVTLYQTFYSKENCTYNWTFSGPGSGINRTDALSTSEVTLDVYDKSVLDKGWNVTLTMTGFQEMDLGLYTVMVCNSVGCNSSDVNLTAAGPPWVPLDFHVVNTTKTSILLGWKSNFPGGDFTQVFILHYRKLGDSKWSTLEERNDNPGGYVYAEVTGLEAGMKYELRVRAKNDRKHNNEGPFTDTISSQTRVEPTETSNVAMAAGAGAGATLLVIIVIVIVVFIIRRKRDQDKKEKDDEYTADGKKTKRNEDELVLRDNALYETSDGAKNKSESDELVMQDNDLYDMSGNVQGAASAQTSSGDVYAQVKPKKKATGGDVCAQPMKKGKGKDKGKEKVDEGDVYAKPMKGTNLEKGKERMKDKGKGKEGNKKQKKTAKEDKMPLKQQNKQKRDDVYENTVPGQFGDGTYANTAFVHDEEPEMPQGAKSGKDDDGCTYVTVEFGNAKPGTQVVGTEDSTEYAAIAFGKVGAPLPPEEEEKKKE